MLKYTSGKLKGNANENDFIQPLFYFLISKDGTGNVFRNALVLCIVHFVFTGFSANTVSAQATFHESLNDHWQFSYKDNSFTAEVPGCIHMDLFRHKLIADPFAGNNDSSLQWIGQMAWTYFKNFDISDSLWKKHKIEMVFKGLDTYASVYLNDSLMIRTDNMFRTWSVSCKSMLRKKNNTLKIVFESADNESKKLYDQYGYKLPGEERVMTRKAQYQYGWDFGPKYLTCGIWKDVEIQGWDYFTLSSLAVSTDTINDRVAWLTADLKINAAGKSYLTFRITDKKTGFVLADHPSVVNKGKNDIRIQFQIKNPKRWWCNGYGEPYLYDLKFAITDKNKNFDETEIEYGLKKIELVQEPDEAGSSFYFKLNGLPVFMKGANYVPMNIFPAAIQFTNYNSLLSDAVNCHFNMLRVWGGGIYESEDFYKLCDQKGIMIWQDFMFACGMYPFDSLFLLNVKSEAEEQVSRLNNHVSISLFCGNNESSEGWRRWGWQDGFTENEREKIWMGYQKLFNEILPAAVHSYSTVPYWESSPSLGRGDKKHTTRGDAHNWFVWHDGEPFENYEQNVPRFMSEFGFQSYPSLETIQTFTGKEDSLFSDAAQSHQKNKNGNAIINKYLLSNYGTVKNINDFVYLSQLMQAEGIRKGIEAHRRNKPYCMGCLYWQYNDCWPAISWSSRDFSGKWKALQYFSKKAFDTFLISISEEKDSMLFYLVSDSVKNISVALHVTILDFEGNKGSSKEILLSLMGNAVGLQKISKQSLNLLPGGNTDKIVYASLQSMNKILAENIYYFAKPLQLPLLKPEIYITKGIIPDGIELQLSCDKPVKNVMLFSESGGFFSDNFFDMLPGKPHTITLKNILPGTVPEIKIKSIFETR